MQRPQISSVIIGAKSVDQLKQNLLATSINLTAAHMNRLDQVSAYSETYPWNMINPFNTGRKRNDMNAVSQ